MASNETETKDPASYAQVKVQDRKTQIRVLYIRHGESISNHFKEICKKAYMTPKRLLDETVQELRKMDKILDKSDLNRIKSIKLEDNPHSLKEAIRAIEDELQDVVLSEKGVREAKRMRKYLFGEFGDEDYFELFKGEQAVSHIIVSPLRRTQQTLMEIFGPKLHALKSNVSVDVNPYFHEWVKRDTASSRCCDVDITVKFPELYAKHGASLFHSKSWLSCCSSVRTRESYAKDSWLENLIASAKKIPKGWSEKGSELAKEYAYGNGAQNFTTFYQKQVTKILSVMDAAVDDGMESVLIVAHGMIGRVIFKEFLGDFDMKNYAIIEALWDKSKRKFVESRFLQNRDGDLPTWGKLKKRKF